MAINNSKKQDFDLHKGSKMSFDLSKENRMTFDLAKDEPEEAPGPRSAPAPKPAAQPAPAAPAAKPAAAPAPGVTDDVQAEAEKVIRGEYGYGVARRDALGAQYKPVQARVNQILAQ